MSDDAFLSSSVTAFEIIADQDGYTWESACDVYYKVIYNKMPKEPQMISFSSFKMISFLKWLSSQISGQILPTISASTSY